MKRLGLAVSAMLAYAAMNPLAASVAAAPLAGVCTLGTGTLDPLNYQAITGTPNAILSVETLLHPSACGACGPAHDLVLNDVSFSLQWFAAGSESVTIAIGVPQGTASCPNPYAALNICGPVRYLISSPGPGTVTHTLPMPPGCCISADEFLIVDFTRLLPANSTQPYFGMSTSGCSPCGQYVDFSEWCSANPRAVWMAVGADCCSQVPVRETTWGTLKIRYR